MAAGPISIQLVDSLGERIDLVCAEGDTNVAAVVSMLHSLHNYSRHTKLMYSGKVLNEHVDVSSLPVGSVIIAGKPRTRSKDAGAASPSSSSVPAASPPSPHISVHLVVPATNHRLTLSVLEDATVGDLVAHAVAKDYRLAGARLVANGKLLDQPQLVLHNIGIVDGCTVHAAVGEAAENPSAILLSQVEAETVQLESLLTDRLASMASLEKKGYYEKAMRLLFSLDNLVDLPVELKPKRKDVAHRLQKVQDSLAP